MKRFGIEATATALLLSAAHPVLADEAASVRPTTPAEDHVRWDDTSVEGAGRVQMDTRNQLEVFGVTPGDIVRVALYCPGAEYGNWELKVPKTEDKGAGPVRVVASEKRTGWNKLSMDAPHAPGESQTFALQCIKGAADSHQARITLHTGDRKEPTVAEQKAEKDLVVADRGEAIDSAVHVANLVRSFLNQGQLTLVGADLGGTISLPTYDERRPGDSFSDKFRAQEPPQGRAGAVLGFSLDLLPPGQTQEASITAPVGMQLQVGGVTHTVATAEGQKTTSNVQVCAGPKIEGGVRLHLNNEASIAARAGIAGLACAEPSQVTSRNENGIGIRPDLLRPAAELTAAGEIQGFVGSGTLEPYARFSPGQFTHLPQGASGAEFAPEVSGGLRLKLNID